MPRIFAFLLMASVALATPRPIAADDCVLLAGGRIFASRSGLHGLKITLKRGGSPARLFTFDPDGKERTLWTAKLVSVPTDAFFTDDGGVVVTIASGGCSDARQHAVVVYGAKGAVLGDYRLDQILTAEEIRDHGRPTISSIEWAEDARFRFDRGTGHIVITLSWGREIRVDVVTGRVVSER